MRRGSIRPPVQCCRTRQPPGSTPAASESAGSARGAPDASSLAAAACSARCDVVRGRVGHGLGATRDTGADEGEARHGPARVQFSSPSRPDRRGRGAVVHRVYRRPRAAFAFPEPGRRKKRCNRRAVVAKVFSCGTAPERWETMWTRGEPPRQLRVDRPANAGSGPGLGACLDRPAVSGCPLPGDGHVMVLMGRMTPVRASRRIKAPRNRP